MIFRSTKMQVWFEATVTAFVLFFIVDYTVSQNLQIKSLIPIATITALAVQIMRIVDFSTKDLKENISSLEQQKESITKLTDALVKRPEDLQEFLEQYGNTNPSIKDTDFFVELMQKINNYCDDAKSLSKDIYANIDANKWLQKESNIKALAKAAVDIFQETDLKDFGNSNTSFKSKKEILERDIINCLHLVSISLPQMIDLTETNIQKSELVSKPNITKPYLSAIENIKNKQLREKIRKKELSEQAFKEIEKYLKYLIDKLS